MTLSCSNCLQCKHFPSADSAQSSQQQQLLDVPGRGGALYRMAFMYDVEGALIRKIKLLRINDLALTRDGTVMVMVTQEKLIKVQRLSSDGKYV